MEPEATQTGTRFVIIAAPRTGSNHLCARLRAQPDVWCHGEVYSPKRVWVNILASAGPIDESTHASLKNLRDTNRDEFLTAVFAMGEGRPHVGFKIFENHGRDEVAQLVEDKSLAKIVLWRENFLAVYASRLAARASGAYNPHQMANMKRPLVQFAKAQFEAERAGYEAFFARCIEQLATTGQSFHRIGYTEINSYARVSALLGFIGANPAMKDITAPDVRGSSDILSRFSNPETVEAHLREHGLTHWAHEAAHSDSSGPTHRSVA